VIPAGLHRDSEIVPTPCLASTRNCPCRKTEYLCSAQEGLVLRVHASEARLQVFSDSLQTRFSTGCFWVSVIL